MIKVGIPIIVGIVAVVAIYLVMNTPSSQKTAQPGDTLSVHYTGTLQDGTVFDSSRTRGIPFTFTLGQGQVIAGWDEGLVGVKVGETRHLVIPPEKAYGPQGIPGVIPPESTLIFDVEVVEIRQ
ncbi:MAG: FKBP-type peptidyl-prolyl cis-trans isomerase [Candidatus Pacearchaeota archaeon]|nr:FKBP-type peptidyl-prolyl cis-trans isomerase [Candidatus Pacearchaeota archaeon]